MAMFQVTRKMMRPMPVSLARFCTNVSGGAYGSAAPSGFEGKESAFVMPPVRAMNDVPGQGWAAATVVGLSAVPGAGNGRFAAEVVKTGAWVIAKPLIQMAKVETVAALANDQTILMATVEDLERFIDLAKSEGGHSRETILSLYEHFMYGFDGVHACLNMATWTVNHGDKSSAFIQNVDVQEMTLPGGATALVGVAMHEIQAKDELYMDYRLFKLPEFYMEYCKKNNIEDVRTVTLKAAYGSVEACYNTE